jgi:hypothetical protein
LEDAAEAPPIELMSPWEFATWQPTDEASQQPPAPEPEASEPLELAKPWEYVRWTPDDELPEPEPAPTSPEEDPNKD